MTNAETRKPWRGRIGWLEAGFLALLVVALGLRLWELGGRPMHYDEAIHLHYAWRLSNGDEYFHSPWMHGPFQIEMSALIFRVLGDTDFTARVGYALFGTGLAALPYLLRRSLGRTGALFTGLMLAVSPTLLYFSRFGRNDIIMAFWAALLLVLMWRHFEEDKDRYLYLASAVLAVMFATKETAFFVAASLGALAFLLAIPQWAPLLFRRAQLRDMAGPAGFCLLIATLTLPQWSALGALFQDLVGLDLINRGAESTGITGSAGMGRVHAALARGQRWALGGRRLGGPLWRRRWPQLVSSANGTPTNGTPTNGDATNGDATNGTATRCWGWWRPRWPCRPRRFLPCSARWGTPWTRAVHPGRQTWPWPACC